MNKLIHTIWLLIFLNLINALAASPGDLDLSFAAGSGETGSAIQAIAVQADGKILVGGSFSSFGGVPRAGFARLNPDGSIDASFNPNVGAVAAIAVQPDSKIVVGTRTNAGRVNPDGSLDEWFSAPGASSVVSLAIGNDGKILVAYGNSIYQNGVFRINTNGGVDSSFMNNAPEFPINAMTLFPNGEVVAAGLPASMDEFAPQIVKLSSSGSIDNNFQPGLQTFDTTTRQFGDIQALAAQTNGSVLVGGNFSMFDGNACANVAQLNGSGFFQTGFAFGMDATVRAIALQTNGQILFGGDAGLARTDPYGNGDTTFNASPLVGSVNCLAIQPDGRILVGSGSTIFRLFANSNSIVPAEPQITNQPSSQTNLAGILTNLSVGVSAYPAAHFQWQKGGVSITDGGDIAGTASPALVFTNLQLSDAGPYDVIVSNSYGSVTSQVAVLTVVSKPGIVVQPLSLTNHLNMTAVFSATASGTSPLFYQWRKDGINLYDSGSISGSATPALIISMPAVSDMGGYDVIVTNNYGSITSQVATLTILVDNFAARTLPATYDPGEVITVRLDAKPPPGTTNWYLAENYPNYWTVLSASNATSTNDLSGQLIYSFTNGQARTFYYTLHSVFERDDTVTFSGCIELPGVVTNVVSGDSNIVAHREWQFVGPQLFWGGEGVTGGGYGAGRWVASSEGWTTTLASNATHWSYPVGSLPFGNNGYPRMAFLGGKFIWWGYVSPGGGMQGQLAASEDGLSWKPGRPSSNGVLFANLSTQGPSTVMSVAYGNGVYAAVGQQGMLVNGSGSSQGAIWISTNGYEWDESYVLTNAAAGSRYLHSVAFGDGKFISVGDSGTVVSSTPILDFTNGLMWSETQDPLALGTSNTLANQNLGGVGFGPAGWFVVKSGVADGLFLGSTNDGVNWFLRSGVNAPASSYDNTFYADGKYWFTGPSDSYFTTDGASWNRIEESAIRRATNGVNPLYLGGGQGGEIDGSNDGTNWTMLSPPALGYWPNYQTIIPFGAGTLVSGAQAIGGLQILYRTSNGQLADYAGYFPPLDNLPWGGGWPPSLKATGQSTDANLNWSPAGLPLIGDYIELDGRTLVAGILGDDGQGHVNMSFKAEPLNPVGSAFLPPYLTTNSLPCPYEDYYQGPNVSQDNVNWGYLKASFAQSPSGFDLYAEAAYFSGDGDQVNWGHYFSPDGTNWVSRTPGLTNISAFPGIRGIAYGASNYVAVGIGAAPGISPKDDRIYASSDGNTYKALPTSAVSPAMGAEGLTGLAFGGGVFVAVGDQGRVLYSTNGLSWQTAHLTDGTGWNRVRYLNNGWAAVGNAGRAGFSSDGAHWTVKSTGVDNNLNDIATFNGYYMIVGNNAMVLQSTFPAATTLQILPASVMARPGGAFQFTVQTSPNTLPVIQTSSDLVHWSDERSIAHSPPDATGVVTFTDSPPPNASRLFYRARLP